MSAYDSLFISVEKICPKCDNQSVNLLGTMLICEKCGWYYLYREPKKVEGYVKRPYNFITKPPPIKKGKRRAKRIETRKPMSEFMLHTTTELSNQNQ